MATITSIKIGPQIDEFTELPKIKDDVQAIHCDLNDVKFINSSGVREWSRWTMSLKAQLILLNVPKCFIDQVNMINGFLPLNAIIESFWVPYFSDQTEEETNILFTRNVDFQPKQLPESKSINDSEGHPMNWDITPEKYFRFIQKFT